MHWFPRFVTLGAVLALGITLVPLGGSQPVQAQPESPEVPGELLVKFRPGTRGQDVADAHRSQQAQVNASIKGIDVDVVKVPPGQEKAAADGYLRNPNVQ